MKKHLLFNQSFGTVGSPNQTGETLTRENRIGLMSYLRRTLMLLFAVLMLSIANIATAWGTDITWNFANAGNKIDLNGVSTHNVTADDGASVITFNVGASGDERAASGTYIKINGKSSTSSGLFNNRWFSLKAPSAAGKFEFSFDSKAATMYVMTGASKNILLTSVAGTASSTSQTSVITNLTAGTTDLYIAVSAAAYIKYIKWIPADAPADAAIYTSLVQTTMSTGATLSSSSASQQNGGSGVYADYSKYYKTGSSGGYVNISFTEGSDEALALNSNGSNRGRIRIYYGGKSFTLSVNGSATGITYTPTTSPATFVNIAEYTIPNGTTELSSIRMTDNSGSSGGWWSKVEVLTYTPSGYSITYDCNEGTSGCPSTASNQTALPDPLPAGPTAEGYTFGGWYMDEELTDDAEAGDEIDDDVTLYAKMTPYYFNYNDDKASHYVHYSMGGNLSYTQALDGNSTYYFYFNDGGSHQYALAGSSTMTSNSCTDWDFIIDYNTYCGISTTAPGDYTFTINESNKASKLVVSVTYPSSVVITLARNDGSGTTTTWYAAEGGTIPTPPDPSDRDGFAFEGWYSDAECTTPWVWSTTVNSATTLYAKWVNAWYYHEAWSDPAWKAQLMTRSTNGTYWYLHTYASGDNREFKIQQNGTWYDRSYNTPGYLCTDIDNMNSSSNTWNTTDTRCAVNYNSGRYYILVFPPNTSANSTSDPIICASTYLPEEYYTVPSSRTIYFDNSEAAWTNIYFRKGRTCHSEATALSLVPGTASLYKVTTASAYTGYQAFHLANNQSATGSSSIYTVNGGGKAITKATVFQKYNLDADVTFTPGDADGDPSDGCQYYDVEKTTGMKTDNVAITAPTDGTIRVSYTNTSGSSANFTSGNADLAHTCIITPTGIGNTGYEVSGMTINGNSHTSGNTYTITGATTIAATFSLINYNIDYSTPSNGDYTIKVASGTASSADKTATMGQTITLAASATTGYHFTGWTITNDDTSSDITSSVSLSGQTENATFTMPAANVSITATFALNTYTVNFAASPAGYGSVSPTSIASVNHGSTVSIALNVLTLKGTNVTATPTAAGSDYTYAFSSWSVSNGASITEAQTITANFTRTPQSYTVTHTLSNVTTSSGTTATYGTNYTATFAASSGYALPSTITVTRGGSTLTGGGTHYTWNSGTGELTINGDQNTDNITVSITGNVVHTVTYSAGASATCKASDTQASAGANIELAEPTWEDHTFLGWYVGGTKIGDAGDDYEPKADITVYGAWKEDCAGGGGGSSCATWEGDPASYTDGSFTADDNLVIVADPNTPTKTAIIASARISTNPSNLNKTCITIDGTDKYITGYLSDGSEITSLSVGASSNSDSNDALIVAVFCADEDFSSGVKVETATAPNINTAYSDATFIHEFIPPSGTKYFRIYRKINGGVTIGDYTAPKDGVGSQTLRIFHISACSSSGGTCYYVTYDGNGAEAGLTSDPTAYNSSSNTVTVKANGAGGAAYTKSGYTFDGWNTKSDGSGDSKSAGGTFTITKDTVLYAQWSDGSGYSITYDCDDANSGCPSNVAAATNLPNPLPSAPVKDGNAFVGWYTNSTKTTLAVAGATLVDDVTLYAKWVATHTVTVTYGAGGSAASAASSTVGETLTTTITATPATGYNFSAWEFTSNTGSATLDNTASNPATLTMGTANVTVNATFSAKTYSVSLDQGIGSSGSENVTMTYNSSSHTSITAPTAPTGYTFAGWYTAAGGTGSMVMNASGVLQASVDGYTGEGGIWTKDATCTLYAKYTANYPDGYLYITDVMATPETKAGYTITASATDADYDADLDGSFSHSGLQHWAKASEKNTGVYTLTFSDALTASATAAGVAVDVWWGSDNGSSNAGTKVYINGTADSDEIGYQKTSSDTRQQLLEGLKSRQLVGTTSVSSLQLKCTDNAGSTWFRVGIKDIPGYLLTYDDGEGTGAPSASYQPNATITLSSTVPTRSGHVFRGWQVGGSGTVYQPGDEFSMPAVAVTLVAKWDGVCMNFAAATSGSSETPAEEAKEISTASGGYASALSGGTMTFYGRSGAIGNNDTYGLVFDSKDDELLTVTLTDAMFEAGTIIILDCYSLKNSTTGKEVGFTISGNACAEGNYITTANAYQRFTRTYVVTEDDGIEGTSTFVLEGATTNKVYLKGMQIAGCMSCMSITPTLTYSKTTIWMDDADLTATPNLNKDGSTGSATYVSNNTDVATVNESTGVVKAVARGTATITATIAADGTHCGKTATCDITVKDINCGMLWEIAGVTLTAKDAGTPSGSLIASSSGYGVSCNDWSTQPCGKGGKLGSDGNYVCLTLKSGEYFQNGDRVVVDVAKVPDTGDKKLHIYAGTNSAGDQLGENASPVCGENEITLSGISSNISSITLYRTSSTDKQNPYVVSLKVYRYGCPDSKEFLPTGDDGNWNATANWIGEAGRGASLPTIDDRVIISKPVTVDVATAKAERVEIGENASVTIAPTGGLVVATMITKDGSATTPSDLIIESSNDGTGALITGEESTTTQATVGFYTKAIKHATRGYVNQYIGIPFTGITAYDRFYDTYVYEYIASSNAWSVLENNGSMSPFTAYNLMRDEDTETTLYSGGTLILPGTTTHKDKEFELTLRNASVTTTNMFANPYTAPIDITALDEDDDFTGIEATIYLFNAGSNYDVSNRSGQTGGGAGQWLVLPVASVKDAPESYAVTTIPSQQAFMVKGTTGASHTMTIDYKKHVYDPAKTSGATINPARAPKQDREETALETMNLTVQGLGGASDRVLIFMREDFTIGFDNGWDGRKMKGKTYAPYFYAATDDGKMAVNSVPTAEGTVLGFKAGTEDNFYTFSFEYDGEDIWYLNDLKEQKSTLIDAVNTYTFESDAGDAEARFVISATPINKVSTGNEDVGAEAAKVRKVIINDHIYIIRGGRMYSVDGALVR